MTKPLLKSLKILFEKHPSYFVKKIRRNAFAYMIYGRCNRPIPFAIIQIVRIKDLSEIK